MPNLFTSPTFKLLAPAVPPLGYFCRNESILPADFCLTFHVVMGPPRRKRDHPLGVNQKRLRKYTAVIAQIAQQHVQVFDQHNIISTTLFRAVTRTTEEASEIQPYIVYSKLIVQRGWE